MDGGGLSGRKGRRSWGGGRIIEGGGRTASRWRLSGEPEGSIDPTTGGRSLALSETDADGVSGAAARGK